MRQRQCKANRREKKPSYRMKKKLFIPIKCYKQYVICSWKFQHWMVWILTRKIMLKLYIDVKFHGYQPDLPSTMCLATSNGNWTPFISNSVTLLIASIQASNGEKQTYQLAQKKPTGQARNHSTRNQIIAHRTFMVYFVYSRGKYIINQNKNHRQVSSSLIY